MYHRYDGGGVVADGPAVLVRKGDGERFSAYASWHQDNTASASIDVEVSGSPYVEERTEYSLGVDYLHGKTITSLAFTNSSESDYVSDSYSIGVSMDMFGDLTNVSLGYAAGADEIKRNIKLVPDGPLVNDPGFEEDLDRQVFRVDLSQILTKNALLTFSWETITDEGYLNNPYRSVRSCTSFNTGGECTATIAEPERYPNTRTSNAAALRARYFLPWRAALSLGYRSFFDDWEIEADTYELSYTHPLGRWVGELRYRHYTQTSAEFYSDLFPSPDFQNFLARDKELSTYTTDTIGLTLSYEFLRQGWGFVDRGSFNIAYDRINFDYADFRDARLAGQGFLPGNEPLYNFDADIYQVYLSLFY
jgi:hypothetical protein